MITDDDFVYAHSANRPQGITIAKYGKHDEKKHNSVLKMERVIMHAIVHEVTKTLSLERTLHTANEPPFTPNVPDHTHRSHSKHQAPRQYVSIGSGVCCLCSPLRWGVLYVPSRGIFRFSRSTAVGSRLDLERKDRRIHIICGADIYCVPKTGN